MSTLVITAIVKPSEEPNQLFLADLSREATPEPPDKTHTMVLQRLDSRIPINCRFKRSEENDASASYRATQGVPSRLGNRVCDVVRAAARAGLRKLEARDRHTQRRSARDGNGRAAAERHLDAGRANLV